MFHVDYLSVLYCMIGRYGAELSALAYRAEPDVRKMYELAVTYCRWRGVGWLSVGILRIELRFVLTICAADKVAPMERCAANPNPI